ncbi:MAG: hypothetical protein AAB954_01590 [Patescibacteria group bacterium]
MGFKREALRAGATPKTTPTIADTPKAKETDQKDTEVGNIPFMTAAVLVSATVSIMVETFLFLPKII